MKITVMIPTYFSEDVIGYCIGSVINHVDRIIVVDGKFTGDWEIYTGKNEGKKPVHNYSQDKTEKICRSFGSKVKFFRRTGPPGSKLNAYLKEISEDCHWILEMDADEVMCSNGIIKLKQFLQTPLADKYGNFAIRYYHIYEDFEHEIDTRKAEKLGRETFVTFCYVSRLHYYEKGFRFDGVSSEIMRDERGWGRKVWKPADNDVACYGQSYPIPEGVCKMLHLRFWRKNAFHVKRILGEYYDEEISRKSVMLRYGQYCVEFPIKRFHLKEEFPILYESSIPK